MSGTSDLTDFALSELPGQELHDVLHAMRAEGPIARAAFLGLPAFAITSHAVLSEAFPDNHHFPGHRMYETSFEPAIGKSFISNSDPEEHLRYRKLATPAFRSRAVSNYEEKGLAALAHELIDDLVERDEFDLVSEFTARFPYLVITRLLGLPRDREDEFHEWALALLSFRDDPEKARAASEALSAFLAPVVEERRRNPQEDVISGLIQAEIDGRRLEDEEIYSHIRLLFPTGGETTHGSLGNLLYALMTHEGVWERLCQQPERIPDAVEEALRWETPIAVLPRLSRSETIHYHGTEIPPDSWVFFAIAGANRDPACFTDPDRFDIDRPRAANLVFGRGPKSCPGSHFARRNMVVATEVLMQRMPDIELIEPEKSKPRRTVLRCPEALRVRRT